MTAVKTAVAAKDAAEATEANAVNARAAAFDGIGKLATKVKLAAEVNVNDEAFNHDVMALSRRINGGRAAGGDLPADNPATPHVNESENTNSVSQQSFDDILATFDDILARLNSRPDYQPNESEVQIEPLEARHAAMTAANNSAKASIAAARTTRAARDHGAVRCARQSKGVLTSFFGGSSR